ncbi:cytochrome c oxidase assembly protein [Modestobacter sp. Leaf380]|uniref:cytochrome c oxidase assembly protein n=1 Tax=Modestobacter sp. Leaf380 TaxID=1736356 RepID=UPI0006FA0F5C|nr:cytochrome c oxidase assembly protein [Modestobacter sp. Leaf380]
MVVAPAVSMGRQRGWLVPAGPVIALGALIIGVGTTLALLWASGSLVAEALPGIPATSAAVTWAIPVTRVVGDLAAVATAGCLMAAALLAPGHRQMSVAGYRWTRMATWPAAVWLLSSILVAPLQLADFLGTDLASVSARGLFSFTTTIPQGQAQAAVAALTLVLVIGSRLVLTTAGSAALLLIALLASLPPVFTGHAAGSGSHQAAISGLALHVLGVLAWAGGVLSLILIRRLPIAALQVAVTRFSAVAPLLVLLVALSGVLTAATRLTGVADLVDTDYGRQVVIKTAALLALGGLGWAHRRRTLPSLARGDHRAFRRLAISEVLVFAATIGVAVSLSRTPTPQTTPNPGEEEGSAFDALGFPLPPNPTPGQWWTQLWQPYPDPLFPVLIAGAVVAYVWAVRRRTQAGKSWPARRTALLLGGAAVLLVATTSGLARYALVSAPAHALQYLLLGLLGPALVLRAAPGQLLTDHLDRRSPATEPVLDDSRGAAQWLEAITSSRAALVLRRPGPALALFVVVVYLGYTGPVLEIVMRSHAAHVVSVIATFTAGMVLLRSWFDSDIPRRLRGWWIAGWAAIHVLASVALLTWPTALAVGWWTEIDPAWRPAALTDQRHAAVVFLLVGLMTAGAIAVWALVRASRSPSPVLQAENSDSWPGGYATLSHQDPTLCDNTTPGDANGRDRNVTSTN